MLFGRKILSLHDEELIKQIDMQRIPEHIAIIMDGNGRWAKKKNLPRSMGHRAGVETIREIVKVSSKLGVKYLTLYSFSTENWKRPPDEVNVLMNLLVEYLRGEFDELNRNNVIINYIGDITGLPEVCQRELLDSKMKTKDNTGLTLNLALNYGGRDEITKAVRKIASEVKRGVISPESINENLISQYMFTANMPDPDLIIRPSGELRISNFLLWQIAYSELWFSDVYWPDFKPNHLYKAIIDYQKRDRRFGSVK